MLPFPLEATVFLGSHSISPHFLLCVGLSDLRNNSISSVPPELGNLSKLSFLWVSMNVVLFNDSRGASLCCHGVRKISMCCSTLRSALSDNGMTSIPEWVRPLSKLVTLYGLFDLSLVELGRVAAGHAAAFRNL